MLALPRKLRAIIQRAFLLAILTGAFIYCYSYVNLEFCYKVMSQNNLNFMCKKYKNNAYSGSLCEELCKDTDAFKEFKCPQNEMKTTVFTAVKHGDVYAIKLARNIRDELSWTASNGLAVYPKIEDFHHIVKIHITLTYNITLDDNMIRALVNQEIHKDNAEQMLSFWRLFKDNNYMIGKLFDEDGIFPTILGSCGPYYATENLNIIKTDQSIMQYISFDWKRRLKIAINILEFIFRLDEMRPEPLKMCKMQISLFGLTADKRLKYQSAEFVQVESQIDKRLSNGGRCSADDDCHWHACMGKCDRTKAICNHIQQNNNLQIYCEHLLKGGGLFPGLLASARTPRSLMTLMKNCINPSQNTLYHYAERPYAANTEVALRLYNEMKRLLTDTANEKHNDNN